MLKRLLYKRGLRRHRPGFRSPLGGLWTDRMDAFDVIGRERSKGQLGAEDAARLTQWVEDGYVIIKNAVPLDLIDAINDKVDDLWVRRETGYRIDLGGAEHPIDPALRPKRYKLLDLHARFRPALEAAFAPELQRFLTLIFKEHPLLFQTLNFETGSTQPMHQDTAYVVVNRPMELAASWIALEDIQPGSGELIYYPGSHTLRQFLFGGAYKNWNAERDGQEQHRRFLEELRGRAEAKGLELRSFLPGKGDVLIWSADLVHGGAPVTNPGLTRRSLVGHYCPQSATPYYFSYKRKQRTRRPAPGGGSYASSYYPI